MAVKLKIRLDNFVSMVSAKFLALRNELLAAIEDINNDSIQHTAINDYVQTDNQEIININQLLLNFYKNVIEDGGTIEHYLSAGDFITGTENQGNIIRNVHIIDGKVEHIELDFIKESEIPPIPASKVVGLNTWTTKEW